MHNLDSFKFKYINDHKYCIFTVGAVCCKKLISDYKLAGVDDVFDTKLDIHDENDDYASSDNVLNEGYIRFWDYCSKRLCVWSCRNEGYPNGGDCIKKSYEISLRCYCWGPHGVKE